MDVSTHGFACACGAVRGTARGEPDSITWCHCEDCRRESGAPAFVWVGWKVEAIDDLASRSRARTTRPGVTRMRCEDCGSLLGYSDEGLPGLVYVPLGLFDEPDAFVPTEHAYWPERVAGLSVADGLPKRDATTQERVAR